MNPLATDFSPSRTANTTSPSAEQAPRLPPVDRSRAVRLTSPYSLTREQKQQALLRKKAMLEYCLRHSAISGTMRLDSRFPPDLEDMVHGSKNDLEMMKETHPRLMNVATPAETDHLAQKKKRIDLGASENQTVTSQEALPLSAAERLSIDLNDLPTHCPGEDVVTNELQSIEEARHMLALLRPEAIPTALTSKIASSGSSESWFERQQILWQLYPWLFQNGLLTLDAYNSFVMDSTMRHLHVSSLDPRRPLQNVVSHAAPLQVFHPLYPDQSPVLAKHAQRSQTTSRFSHSLPKDQSYNVTKVQSSVKTPPGFTAEGDLLPACTYSYRDHTALQSVAERSRAQVPPGLSEGQPRGTGSRRPRHKINRLVSRLQQGTVTPEHKVDITWLRLQKYKNDVGLLLYQADTPEEPDSSTLQLGRHISTEKSEENLSTASYVAPQEEGIFLTDHVNDSSLRKFKISVANGKPPSTYIANDANVQYVPARVPCDTGNWSHSKSWISDYAKERMAFARILNNLRHIRADKSPFVPRSFSSFTAFKAEVAEANKAELSQVVGRRLKDLERHKLRTRDGKRPGMVEENLELFGGLRFADKLSPVFAAENCFNSIDSEELDVRGEWPSLIELKEESDGRGHTACGSWPLPRDHALDPKAMNPKSADIYNTDGTIRWHLRAVSPDRRFIRPVTPQEA